MTSLQEVLEHLTETADGSSHVDKVSRLDSIARIRLTNPKSDEHDLNPLGRVGRLDKHVPKTKTADEVCIQLFSIR